MANKQPEWTACRALSSPRRVALDKGPGKGVRPVGIADAFARLRAKCVTFVCGDKATDACGVEQLCAGLEAGIKGLVHAARLLWQTHAEEEEWGFLLVDAKRAVNKGNKIGACQTVRHKWPSGA